MTDSSTSLEQTFDVLAGFIIAAHGVQGALKVRVATKTAVSLISPGTGVSRRPADVKLAREGSAESGQTAKPIMTTITQLKETTPGSSVYIARAGNVRDRTQAEGLVGMSIFAPSTRRAPLQEDEYFTDELIGLSVVGDRGQQYGKITAIHAQPANDVYETDQGALIPAVKAFVSKIDVAAGTVTVYEVPGLRPEEAEEVRSDGEERGGIKETVLVDEGDIQ